ncbi:hypothetical protein C8035_v012273 [Colletotrichum spinosum]|uniref:Rhodopsin domain-containing protein n=1 Tax=Colletotrichum spinosum TaxID=1347390 RepID=A0A4R8Q332_9PEZI|nr:hypothetical protein C8035_v012273 [Colletotrichum spinosum]
MEAIEDGGPPGLAPHGKAVIACTVVSAALSGMIVGLRFFARLTPAMLLGKEDWCILVAWFFSALTTIGMCIQVRTGIGEAFATLSLYQQQTFFKWSYMTIIFYNCGLALVKISILLLYLRILRHLNYRIACYVALGIVILVSLWTILSSLMFCVPLRRNWDQSVQGFCFPKAVHWFTNASLNIFTDFTILILPLPILPKIKQTRQQKISLYLIFALGFLCVGYAPAPYSTWTFAKVVSSVCVVSILRIPPLIAAKNSTDPTRDSPGIAQWSVIELNTAIVCACLITLKRLAARFCPRILGSSSGDARKRGHGSGPDDEAVPATVGSKESENASSRQDRGLSGVDSVVHLNHDTFGVRTATDAQISRATSEAADLGQGEESVSKAGEEK